MKKLEKIWWTFLTIAALGIVLFWVFGFNGHKDAAAVSFATAGVAAWVALSAAGLWHLRRRRSFF